MIKSLPYTKILITLLAAACPLLAIAQDGETAAAEEASPVKADRDVLVFFGYMMGSQSGIADGFDAEEIDAILEGYGSALRGGEPTGNPQELMPKLQSFMVAKQAEMQAAQQKEAEAAAAGNLEAGTAYISEIAQLDGVQKSASGLYYKIETQGEGESAADADSVQVHYHGTLTDGTVFDSSVDRGEPATFPVGGVIPGFKEGLQLLGKGGKATLYIPSEIGYGNSPAGAIPPGSTLTFEIEILDILRAEG